MLQLPPIWLTVLTSLFAFLITSIGGAMVFCFGKINKIFMQLILSFSAGIMIASSFFSLIMVAINQCDSLEQNPAFVCTAGVLVGIIFVVVCEIITDKIFLGTKRLGGAINQKNKQAVLSAVAISLHNIPEGLCIGVAFAGASVIGGNATMGALLLAFGIGLQNFPEGASVSLPLYNSSFSKKTSFAISVISGVVEPIFAVVGFYFTGLISSILPFLLSLAGGAMISVSCIELLPESLGDNKNIATIGLGVGFCFMMLLDLFF